LAGFLYLGSGLGLFFWQVFSRLLRISSSEAHLKRTDFPWLAGAILAGGIMAPIILMFSLRSTPAATASLLLNFEVVATAIIAVIFFKEAVGSRIWLAIGCITLSTILLSLNPFAGWGFSIGSLGVIAACILWGTDNNLTRNISFKDPIAIVAYKGLIAGSLSLLLAFALDIHFPTLKVVFECMLLGLLSYGLSIVLFILSMRDLGSTRTVALFSSAPFVGVILSFIIFREPVSTLFYIGLPIMILGAALLLGEEHVHIHKHQEIEHEHSHNHDDIHHNHAHLGELKSKQGSHTHLHKHDSIKHTHLHTPDIHHRHSH